MGRPADTGSRVLYEVLYEDPYVTVYLDEDERLVLLVRSSRQFPSIAALQDCYRAVIQVYDRRGRRGRNLLVDSRAPTGRNDPEYERAMFALLPALDRGFGRIGVLVQTAVGKLQFRRWQGVDGIERIISSDEAQLRDQLRAGADGGVDGDLGRVRGKPEPRR
jgi:hypothetical protein